jgi:hypothetical protein
MHSQGVFLCCQSTAMPLLPLRCFRSVEFEAVSGTCPIVETTFQLILMGFRYSGNMQMCFHVN